MPTILLALLLLVGCVSAEAPVLALVSRGRLSINCITLGGRHLRAHGVAGHETEQRPHPPHTACFTPSRETVWLQFIWPF